MDEHKDGFRQLTSCWIAGRSCVVLLVILVLHTAVAQAAGLRQHFDLEAGDASLQLNEFSRQSDLQVLFDFNILRGMKTRAVSGDLDPAIALKSMLKGTNLVFDFVNDHTLAVTPKKPSLVSRMWHGLKTGAKRTPGEDDGLEQVLISGAGENGTQPLLGTQTIQYGRAEIDRSGLATVEDFLRTMPQVFGGGPSQDTTLGREASTNSAHGSGINIRGLDAGATLVLIDGKRVAPSGTAGAFDDISNIPLSIVDHIDVLPDGASAKYGVDALGGVVNFVTRNNFSGMQSQVRGGGVTNGAMGERQFSQLFGNVRDSGSDFLSFEYFQRDPLQAKDRSQYTSDLTPFGGSNFDTYYGGSPGTIFVGNQMWAVPKTFTGAAPTAAELTAGTSNLYDQWLGSDVTPGQERWSVFAKERQSLTDDVQLHFEGLFTRRKIVDINSVSGPIIASVPASNPFYVNPTGGTGNVTVGQGSAAFFGPLTDDNRIDTGNFSLGLSMSPFEGWTANGSVAYTFEKQHIVAHGLADPTALDAALADPNSSTAFNPFGGASNNNPATLASIGGDAIALYNSTLRTIGLAASGPTISLPGGAVDVSVGAERRAQDFSSTSQFPHEAVINSGTLTRKITAEFAELQVPIFGEANPLEFVRRFELSLGARREDFSDVGGATIPKFGLLWSLSKDWNVRSSWTKSFKPPNLPDLVASGSQSVISRLPDPNSSTGTTPVLALYGTNPGLRPENAHSFTFGTDFTLPSIPGLSLSLTYFSVVYADRITSADLDPDVLTEPNFGWLLTRNITPAQLSYACQHSVYAGSQQDCLNSGTTIILDNRLRNIALLKTNGVDLIGRYSFDNPAGKFEFDFNGTYLFKYAQSNTPTDPLVNIVSTQTNPINLKARGSAAWNRLGVGAAGFINFENGYRDVLSTPNRGISPWTTIDLQLSYQTPGDALGWLGNTQFALNVQNLFNVNPPFLNNGQVGLGYDQENADLYGRMASFEIRKRW
jgi:iron complex outermembrane receptor protein